MSPQIEDKELSNRFKERQGQRFQDAKDGANYASFLLGQIQQTFTLEIQEGLVLEFREPTNNDKVKLMKIGSIGTRLYQETRSVKDLEDDLDEVDRIINIAQTTLEEIDLFLESMTVDERLTAENFYSRLPATTKEKILSEIKSRAGMQAEKAQKTSKK